MIKSTSKVYIENGEIKKVRQFIVEDQGKTIYEVLRIIDGKPLFIEEHYNRMGYSFHLNNLELEVKLKELKAMIKLLIKESKIKEGNIKITYNTSSLNFRIYFIKHKYPTKKMYEEGVDTILYFGERENPNAKVVNNEFRNKVNEKIEEREAFEAILVNNQGIITEGSKSNIFMIKDDLLITSKIKDVLPGITRSEIIQMAIKLNIKVLEEDFNYIGLKEVDAMFISGTSPKILPIRSIEEKELDVKNKILRDLMDKFNEIIDNYIKNS